MSLIGIIIIGRNEGERLINCFDSIAGASNYIIYVDSGSSDGSCQIAIERGIELVQLDMSMPFTAARARNAGFQRLCEKYPMVEYVQFLDGDCQMVTDWIEVASNTLTNNADVVAVCGWRRELYPEKSIYNRICDVEWRMGNIGITTNFGGDVMIKVQSLISVGGYNEKVIAAEDDELSVRLRQDGGSILRIDQVCTKHDANMYTFAQWWQRSQRCGYGFSMVSSIHGKPPERKFVKEVRRTCFWGGFIPALVFILIIPTKGLSLLLLARYLLTFCRVTYQTNQKGLSWNDSWAWGLSCSLSVFPSFWGICKFYQDSIRQKPAEIIEYK